MTSARVLIRTLHDCIAAAGDQDGLAFAEAEEHLHRLDQSQVGVAQAGMIRSLLEDSYPAGLDGDDIRQTLEHCVRSTFAWFPRVDAAALVAVLTSALGVFEPDEQAGVVPEAMTTQACLLIADLASGTADGAKPYLDRAMAEIRRAQTIELP